jgi:hypothetical protein
MDAAIGFEQPWQMLGRTVPDPALSMDRRCQRAYPPVVCPLDGGRRSGIG